jgi:hypothetical protein
MNIFLKVQNMKTTKNISNLFMMSVRAFAIVLLFAATTNCTPEESLVEPAADAAEVATEVSGTDNGEGASLTVSGAFVEYSDANLCSECTYVIPEDASVVNGAELGVKAGDVLCLNSAFKYKAVELVNVEGTEGKPVIIANCN